jgi:5-methylcytosine-specific restriction enzyme A
MTTKIHKLTNILDIYVIVDGLLEKVHIPYSGKPKDKKEPRLNGGGQREFPRDVETAERALAHAKYKCEYCIDHVSFTKKSDGMNYTESHHLVPSCYIDDFDASLDIEENICSLCCICHRCLHFGSDEERNVILEELYRQRFTLLKKVGLDISLEKLKEYYENKWTSDEK